MKRELIRRFEGNQEVTEEVADTQMKDLLDKVARKYPNLGRDAALAKIGRENFRKYVARGPGRIRRDGRDQDVERVAARVGADDAGRWVDRLPLRGAGTGDPRPGRARLAAALEALVLGTLIAGITVLGGLLLAVPRRNVPLMPLVLTLAAAGAVWLAITAGGWLAERRRAGGGLRGGACAFR